MLNSKEFKEIANRLIIAYKALEQAEVLSRTLYQNEDICNFDALNMISYGQAKFEINTIYNSMFSKAKLEHELHELCKLRNEQLNEYIERISALIEKKHN